MPDFNDFAPLYAFGLIEKAVQAFFCADALGASFAAPLDDDDPARETWTPPDGGIAFYTAFQADTFQKVRPRVWVALNNIVEFPSARVLDANGVYRASAWRGVLAVGIITEPNYLKHTELRARVAAILPQLQPLPTLDGSGVTAGGVNALLKYHEVGQFAMSECSTHILPEHGYYQSSLNVAITFSVRVTAWPGGTQTA
jgi:hypothetical protein